MNVTGTNPETETVRNHARIAAGLLLISFGGIIGCSVVERTAKIPVNTVAAVVPGARANAIDPGQLQADLLRYADDFFGRTTTALNECAHRAENEADRVEALSWKATLASSALGIATGPNPTANLVDFLSLSTLTRAFAEKRASRIQPPGALDSLLENTRLLETNAWSIAERYLTKDQLAEFRQALEHWLKQNEQLGIGFFRRPQALASGIRQQVRKETAPGSIFAFVGLDPTSGLDPAVREVTRTRLFAERAMFAMERMPFVLRWQTELFTEKFFQDAQVTNALASADRMSRAAESFSQTAAALPDRLSAERKAILDTMEAQEGRLRALSAEVSHTLSAGEKMSTSLNTTIQSFDALMKRFGVGEPDTSSPDTNSPPFNILDYARTAEQIGTMAQQLDSLLKNASGTVDTPALDKRIAQLNELSRRTRTDAKSVLNHGFLLAAALMVLGLACAVAFRLLTRRAKPDVEPIFLGKRP
jgi:hypothetical protein